MKKSKMPPKLHAFIDLIVIDRDIDFLVRDNFGYTTEFKNYNYYLYISIVLLFLLFLWIYISVIRKTIRHTIKMYSEISIIRIVRLPMIGSFNNKNIFSPVSL